MIHIGSGLCCAVCTGQDLEVIVTAPDQARLDAIVGDRNRPLKHVERARIVLLSAGWSNVAAIAREVGVSPPSVWRWQRRFAEAGVDGLLHDKTRPSGTPPLPRAVVERVVALTCGEPPGEATHCRGPRDL